MLLGYEKFNISAHRRNLLNRSASYGLFFIWNEELCTVINTPKFFSMGPLVSTKKS